MTKFTEQRNYCPLDFLLSSRRRKGVCHNLSNVFLVAGDAKQKKTYSYCFDSNAFKFKNKHLAFVK